LKQAQEQKASAPRLAPQINAPQREPVSEARVVSQALPSHADNGHDQRPTAKLNSFADLVALAAEKRDIKFKSALERFIRPISVSDGKIELALEPGAEPGLTNELSRKIEQWTGRRWIVAVSKSGGDATLAQQKKEAKDSAFKWARAQKEVQAVLKTFPSAEILNVTEPEILTTTEETEDEPR